MSQVSASVVFLMKSIYVHNNILNVENENDILRLNKISAMSLTNDHDAVMKSWEIWNNVLVKINRIFDWPWADQSNNNKRRNSIFIIPYAI